MKNQKEKSTQTTVEKINNVEIVVIAYADRRHLRIFTTKQMEG